jgi:hypothetical protein
MQANMTTMNDTLKKTGGVCSEYMVTTTAWIDNKRGVLPNGQLSVLGKNCTNGYVDSDTPIPFIRSDNYDEKLGVTTADKILMVDKDGTQTNLQEVLENIGERSKYMGIKKVDAKIKSPQVVIVRHQHSWVPLKQGQTSRKICPKHYSFQTSSNDDPKNMIIVGTPRGIDIHTDKVGENKLYAHSVDSGTVHNHEFEAEVTDFKIGQVQSDDNPPSSKKSKCVQIGMKGTGSKCNTFVTASIPRIQKPPVAIYRGGLSGDSPCSSPEGHPVYRSLGGDGFGTARVARVSMVEESVGDEKTGVVDEVIRPDDEPIVVTINSYSTIESNTTNAEQVNIDPTDIIACVQEMETGYHCCDHVGKLSELPAMLHKMEKEDWDRIKQTVAIAPVPSSPFGAEFQFKKGAAECFA